MILNGQIHCDSRSCSSVRRESNKWWMVYEAGGTLHITPWNEKLLDWHPQVFHLCGFQCVAKSVDIFMQETLKRELTFAGGAK